MDRGYCAKVARLFEIKKLGFQFTSVADVYKDCCFYPKSKLLEKGLTEEELHTLGEHCIDDAWQNGYSAHKGHTSEGEHKIYSYAYAGYGTKKKDVQVFISTVDINQSEWILVPKALRKNFSSKSNFGEI